MNENINKYEKLYDILNVILVILVVCKRYGDIIINNTIFSSPSKYILLIILSISILSICINYNKIKIIHIIIGIILTIQFLLTKNGVLLFSYISILALKDYKFDKIIKIYFISNLILFILMIILNQIGLKPSIMINKSNDLGFGNPNTTYICFYLIWLSFFYLNYEKKSHINKLLLIISPFFMYSITYCRTGLITIIATIILTIFIRYIDFNKYSKVNKIMLITLSLTPIIIYITSLIISYKFNDNTFLNKILSTRPICWNSYLKNIDKPLNLIGYNNNIRHTLMEGLVPLDSGYISGIYMHGIIIYTLFIALYSYTIYDKYINNNKKYLILIMSILLYSFAETITLDLSTNITLLFLINSLSNIKVKIKSKKQS